MKHRWLWLGIAAAAYSVLMAEWSELLDPWLTKLTGRILWLGLQSTQTITMILALMGFARNHLAHSDGPIRRTLTEGIFPFYIIHQTLIVVLAYNFNRLHLPVLLEAAILITLTTAGCGMTYLIVRRINILRPVFGLKLKHDRPA